MNIHSASESQFMVPPTPKRRPANADKREAIMQAALELFVERGYHGTAVPHVADRAGVGAGTIYRYFANKEGLVNALYQRYKEEVGRELLENFPPDAPAREQFGRFWACMKQFVNDHPQAFAFLELHHHASYLDATSKEVETRLRAFTVGFIRHTQARGEIKPIDPDVLIGIVLGMFIGVVRQSWEGHLELTDEAFAEAERCCWEAIRI